MKPIERDEEVDTVVRDLVEAGEAETWVDPETGRTMVKLTPKGEEKAKAMIADLKKTDEGRSIVDAIRKDVGGDA